CTGAGASLRRGLVRSFGERGSSLSVHRFDTRGGELMRRLWIVLGIVVVFGFTVLGWIGTRIYQEMPPIPDRVVTSDGRQIVGPGDIVKGQGVWQTMGGMEVGSVWGHGSYVAPDWTADWLHRESEHLLNAWAKAENGRPYDDLDPERQAALRARL